MCLEQLSSKSIYGYKVATIALIGGVTEVAYCTELLTRGKGTSVGKAGVSKMYIRV
jgi:hypothetical protein